MYISLCITISQVENVFNIGSPLGVFLVMRGVRPREDMEQHLLPKSVCKRTHNIYDPSDPIVSFNLSFFKYYPRVIENTLFSMHSINHNLRNNDRVSGFSLMGGSPTPHPPFRFFTLSLPQQNPNSHLRNLADQILSLPNFSPIPSLFGPFSNNFKQKFICGALLHQ